MTLTPVTFTARTALVYGSVWRSCLVKYYSCYRKPQTSMTTIDHQKRLTRKATILPSIIFHFPASRGLSRREKIERKERDLCRGPTRSFMQPPTRFVVETDRFSKQVSVTQECACSVSTVCCKFLSSRYLASSIGYFYTSRSKYQGNNITSEEN